MSRNARVGLALLVVAGVVGCSAGPELPEPAGDGTDDLRRSPCACVELHQAPPGQLDIERYRRAPIAGESGVGLRVAAILNWHAGPWGFAWPS